MKKICDVTKAEKERFLPAEIQVVWLDTADIDTFTASQEALAREAEALEGEDDPA